jgi:hypothetical protein
MLRMVAHAPAAARRTAGKMSRVVDRERIVAAALGSARLEDADPGPEVRDELAQWAASDGDVDALEQLAVDAASGAKKSAVPRGAA